MNILFYSTYFSPYVSGAVNLPNYLSRFLTGKNNEVTVLTFKYNRLLKMDEVIDNVKIKRVNYLFKISKGFISPQLFLHSFKLIKHADVVILNLPNFEGVIIAIISYLSGKRLIGMFNCWVDLGKGVFAKPVNLILDISMIIQLKLCSQIVPLTLDYAQYYLKEFAKKIKISIYPPVIKYPISQDYWNKLKDDKNGFFVIGFVGRITKEKGIENLVGALVKLNDPKVLLLIAGPSGQDVAGENEYYVKIMKLLETSHINHRFLGKLSDFELGAFYSIIDLLVLPSINKTEAFGMVQAEAMLFGKPVIASNLPGIRVPINETGMGILVEPKNTDALITAIKEIRTNYVKYICEENINKAKRIFDINIFYNKWLQILNIKN